MRAADEPSGPLIPLFTLPPFPLAAYGRDMPQQPLGFGICGTGMLAESRMQAIAKTVEASPCSIIP
jgi:hypothetical protein